VPGLACIQAGLKEVGLSADMTSTMNPRRTHLRSGRCTSARPSGFTLLELVMVIVILAVLAAMALPKYMDMSADAETAVFRQHLALARTAIHGVKMQAALNAGKGNFTSGGCTGNIDAAGNGTGCLAGGTAVKVVGYNLSCMTGLSQASWFVRNQNYGGYYSNDTAGGVMYMLTNAKFAGNRCYLQCTNGNGPNTTTTLTMRPDLAYTVGQPATCPATLDAGGG